MTNKEYFYGQKSHNMFKYWVLSNDFVNHAFPELKLRSCVIHSNNIAAFASIHLRRKHELNKLHKLLYFKSCFMCVFTSFRLVVGEKTRISETKSAALLAVPDEQGRSPRGAAREYVSGRGRGVLDHGSNVSRGICRWLLGKIVSYTCTE